MMKRLLVIDTVMMVVLLGLAYKFNSMTAYIVALTIFILDLVAFVSIKRMIKNY